jgi:hypothetical protein
MMNVRYHDGQQLNNDAKSVLEQRVRSLDRRLSRVAEDLKFLDVTIEQHLRDQSYTAKLVLRVPNHEMAAAGDGTTQSMALRDAFDDLLDEVGRYRAKIGNLPAIRREEKFHIEKATMAREALDAAQGWPPEPPESEDDLASWGVPPSDEH